MGVVWTFSKFTCFSDFLCACCMHRKLLLLSPASYKHGQEGIGNKTNLPPIWTTPPSIHTHRALACDVITVIYDVSAL